MTRPRLHSHRAFTLVELLAVIAIIGVLSAIVIVSIGSARKSAHASRCGANIRQIQNLSLIWAKDNRDWVPQAMWSYNGIGKLRAGATNLRSVGYTDELGQCPSTEIPSPSYGINNQLVSGGSSGQWGSNYVQYYEHGRYKYSQIQTADTIVFAETTYVSGYSVSGAGAYMAAPVTLGANHDSKCYVGYADGHVALKAPAELTAITAWTKGIIN